MSTERDSCSASLFTRFPLGWVPFPSGFRVLGPTICLGYSNYVQDLKGLISQAGGDISSRNQWGHTGADA